VSGRRNFGGTKDDNVTQSPFSNVAVDAYLFAESLDLAFRERFTIEKDFDLFVKCINRLEVHLVLAHHFDYSLIITIRMDYK